MIYIRSAVHELQDFDGERASSQCFKFMFSHHQRIRWKPLTIELQIELVHKLIFSFHFIFYLEINEKLSLTKYIFKERFSIKPIIKFLVFVALKLMFGSRKF